MFAAERVRQLRVRGGEFGKDRVDENAVGFSAGDHRKIHIRGDGDDTLTVPAVDRRRRYARVQRSDLAQRDFRAIGGADRVPLEVVNGIALVRRQPHEYAHLVPASLNALDLRTEERGARLQGQRFRGDSERARLGPHPELDFADARGVIRAYVEDPLDSPETVDQGACNPGETFRIGVRQNSFDGISQVDDLAAEGDAARMGQDAYLLAPRLHDFPGGDLPLLRAQEFELDGGDIGRGIQGGVRSESPALDARSPSDSQCHSR